MNYSTVLLLFALCFSIITASPLWIEEETPMNLRAFRMTPNQLNSFDVSPHLLLKRTFSKRRGRELFGKRSAVPIDYPDESVAIYDNRFRRRANELFG